MDPPLTTVQVDPVAYLNRAHAIVYSSALLGLFYHRALTLLSCPNLLSFSVIVTITIAELVLAFMWVLAQAFRWRSVRRREFPERLASALDRKDCPGLDVFICTADPDKEPPISVVNTALSVMAFDYPTDKLSVYVSDDGASRMTLFAFVEAARFARYWLPFCREHGLLNRSPEAYFSSLHTAGGDHSEKMKMLYSQMKEKIERCMEWGDIRDGEPEIFREWADDFTRQEHPTIIKVLLKRNKDVDIENYSLPNLVYVSREKRKHSQHHFKAGALNVLIRVSEIMTNAPVVLTLDCDMYSNDPQTPQRALCHLLGINKPAYVQFPQRFKGINVHDIYGGELKRLFRIHPQGMDGFRGPNYVGSGTFFSRRCFYVTPSLQPSTSSVSSGEILERAHQVASCNYEHGTKWGDRMGIRYGSLVEDYNTGYHLHCEGWESVFCDPQRPAFLGDAPITLIDALNQTKRWCIGLLEVAFSKYCPLIFGSKVSLPVGMCYAYYAFWGLWCVPLSIYAILPQVTLLCHVPLYPKVFDPWWYLYVYLFLAAYAQDLGDFLRAKGTIRQWWNDQRMWMVRGVTSFAFGFAQFSLQHMGIPSVGFLVTSKVTDNEQSKLYQEGAFMFGVESPFFLSLTAIAMVNFSSFVLGLVGSLRKGNLEHMAVQISISAFVTMNCWPIYEAMIWRKDEGKMPFNVTRTSFLLVGLIYFSVMVLF